MEAPRNSGFALLKHANNAAEERLSVTLCSMAYPAVGAKWINEMIVL
jgi:hypothetical protein